MVKKCATKKTQGKPTNGNWRDKVTFEVEKNGRSGCLVIAKVSFYACAYVTSVSDALCAEKSLKDCLEDYLKKEFGKAENR